MTTPSGSPAVSDRGSALAVFAISLSVFLATLDTGIANTALPAIATNLAVTEAQSVWVVSSYQLAMVAAMLPVAAFGDARGHKPVFLGGLLLFIVASAGCGFAPSLGFLVASRVVQGLGAAAVMSANTALIRQLYPATALGKGLGLNALVVALGLASGPAVASILLTVTTWHSLFLINLPLGAIAFGLSYLGITETKREPKYFDLIAGALCAGMFGVFVYAMGEFAQGSPASWLAVGWTIAVGLGAALLWRQRLGRSRLLPTDLFRNGQFSLSAYVALCAFVVQGSALVALPFFFHNALGFSLLATGLLITPWPVVGALTAPISGRLSDRVHPAILGLVGLTILAAAVSALTTFKTGAPPVFVGVVMAFCGLGFGLFLSPNQRALMTSAPHERSGAASGILGLSRILGQSIGAAVVALCLTLRGDQGAMTALFVGSAVALAGAFGSALRLRIR